MTRLQNIFLSVFGLRESSGTRSITVGLKEQYEKYFDVEIADNTPDGAVRYSYMDGRARVCRVSDASSWTELFHELSTLRKQRGIR